MESRCVVQDEEQQPVTLHAVVDEGRKQNGQPKKPANQPQGTAQADADRKQFVKDLGHIRGTVDRLAKDVEKLSKAHESILDVVRATGSVTTGTAKQHGDKLAEMLKAITSGQETTQKALEYTQQVLRMCAASPKELDRMRKIAAATDPQFALVASQGSGPNGWKWAVGVGVIVVIALAAVVLA